MNVRCGECGSVFRVDPSRVPDAGIRARCSVCGGVIPIGKQGAIGDDFAAPLRVTPARVSVMDSDPNAGTRAGGGVATIPPPPRSAPPPPRMPTPSPRPEQPRAIPTPAQPQPAAVAPEAPKAPPHAPVTQSQQAPAAAAPSQPQPAAPAAPRRPATPPAGIAAQPRPSSPPSPQSPGLRTPPTSAPTARPAPPKPAGTPHPSGGPARAPIAGAGRETPAASTAHGAAPAVARTEAASAPRKAATSTEVRRPINPFLANDPNTRARRLARALVSDIVTYFPEKHREGLAHNTLPLLFKEEIKKSYDEYREQVGVDFAESTTHFQDALNEILAQGSKVF